MTTTASGFSFTITCPHCAGTLTLDAITQTRQTRRAATTCTACGAQYTVTVSLTRTVTRPTATGARLPMAPLARWLPPDVEDAAARLEVTTRTLHRWRHDGLTLELAERVAEAVRVYPSSIWGSAYYAACGDDESREAA